MLIEISQLPEVLQEQILKVQQGEVIEFANHGEVIAMLKKKPKDSLMATAGILKEYGIDGLEYERQIRSEWDR